MPSKTKRPSKSQSSRLSAESEASPQSKPMPSNTTTEFSQDDMLFSLEEASKMYPSLIQKSALIGEVCDVDSLSKGCKIWLSESCMVASSIIPGSLVSLSLASLGNKNLFSFPLKSLASGLSECLNIDSSQIMNDRAGNYFALARVFSSCKISKNGVRLTLNLSHTMGCPSLGTVVFIHILEHHFRPALSNENRRFQPAQNSGLMVHNCKELYLGLSPTITGLTENSNSVSSVNLPAEQRPTLSENGADASPKTPSDMSGLGSNRMIQLNSPASKVSASSKLKLNDSTFCEVDIVEAMNNGSVKKLLQSCASIWLRSRCLLLGNIVRVPILSQLCIFQVVEAKGALLDSLNHDFTNRVVESLHPDAAGDIVTEAFVVSSETKVYLSSTSSARSEEPLGSDFSSTHLRSKEVKVCLQDRTQLGGLSKEYAALMDIISSSMTDSLSSFGLRTTKGVLLHGPSGTGKTSLARLCAHDAGVNLFCVNGPEIISQYYGESEQTLNEVFDSACRAAPALVFIDELDAIAPARKGGGEELSHRMVATLLNSMDGICRTEGLLVIAATNRPDTIDPALRRPGRFDKEIEIGVPSPKQRLDILNSLLSEKDHSLSIAQIEHLATVTHGFVGADLASLCNEAALICLRHFVIAKNSSDVLQNSKKSSFYESCSGYPTQGSLSSSISEMSVASDILPPFTLQERAIDNSELLPNGFARQPILKVAFDDFEKARMKVRPSAMREVILEVPKVKWEDVGGQREVKAQLMEAVEWPQKYHDAFTRIGTRPPTGILLFGPPGCSKTLMARAVASEAGLNFLAVKGPELFSKWVGESEKAVRSLFAKARANAPSIIFFDEIDGLAIIRGKESDGISVSDRVMSQLLVELDGLHQRLNVTVVAATNRPDKIDPALLRPGRFDRLLYVGPPNESDREEIFRVHLRRIPCNADVSIKELASLTDGYTGADISLICREAALATIEENLDASEIRMCHLKDAIKRVEPSHVESYRELSGKFQRIVHSTDTEKDFTEKLESRTLSWFSFRRFFNSFSSLHQLPLAIFHSKTAPRE